MSLIHGWLPVTVTGVALLLLVAGVGWYTPLGRRRALLAAAGTVAGVAALIAGESVFDWVGYAFPADYYVWIAAPVAALCLCISAAVPLPARWRPARTGPDRAARWLPMVAALLAVPLTLGMVALHIDADYGYFPTWASLGDHLGVRQTSLAELQARRHHADGGTVLTLGALDGARARAASAPLTADGDVVQTAIPATVSHFAARPAWIWVPPAYIDGRPGPQRVIMLLSGTPGSPADWLRASGAAQTAQAYADAHGGVAPILVMPDINGSTFADTECVDSPRGRAETYLTVDVPAFVHQQLGVPAGPRWAVAGLSEGGECAAMLALRHPALFDAFGDFSGLAAPSVSEAPNPVATTRLLFGGHVAAYDAHDPAWLLAHRPPRDVRGLLVSGGADRWALAAQNQLRTEAAHDRLDFSSRVFPGGRHDFPLWRHALMDTFDQLARA